MASFVGAILCQQYNQHGFGAQSHFYLHQNHPAPTTVATPSQVTPHPTYSHHQNGNGNAVQSNQQYQQNFGFLSSTTSPAFMDLDRFNQQAKAAKDQLNYFNQQQSKHLRNQINSVHQDGSEPHFDFVVNQNYSDLEKASEQFVGLGSMAAKQNMPKVIKITKTVAVKQPVPVPYPVPVVKVIKEQVPVEQHQMNHHYQPQQQHYQQSTPATYTMTTEKPFDFKPSPYYSNYTSYISKYAAQPNNEDHNNAISYSPSPSPTPALGMAMAHKIAESYIKQEFFSTPASLAAIGEYDTRPFYVSTSDKEMIKYIPVPYYMDEHGVKHEIPSKSSSSSSSAAEDLSEGVNVESYYKQSSPSVDNHPGKFQTFTISYHPPTTTHATPSYHHHSYPTAQSAPETKYYYSQGDVASVPISSSADNTISSSHHYAVSEVDSEGEGSDEHEHIQYKYVYE